MGRKHKARKCRIREDEVGSMVCHNMVRLENCILLFGGETKLDHIDISLDTIYAYNLDSGKWERHVTCKSDTIPPPTLDASTAVVGDEVFMHGGYIPRHKPADDAVTTSLWILYRNQRYKFEWHEIKFENKAKTIAPRTDHCSWGYNGKLWTWGGNTICPDGYMNDFGNWRKKKYGEFYLTNQLSTYNKTDVFSWQCSHPSNWHEYHEHHSPNQLGNRILSGDFTQLIFL